MGNNLRWDSLSDFTSREAHIYVHCFRCNRTGVFSAFALTRYFEAKGWHTGLHTVYQKLKCGQCGNPPGKLGPTRKLADRDVPQLRHRR